METETLCFSSILCPNVSYVLAIHIFEERFVLIQLLYFYI
nr:MAG TPA_asm: hypothetical protein [Caudoviricetes sp.]